MTTNEFCESSGLAPRELRRWLETGLLEAETIGIPGGGHRYEFAPGQLELVAHCLKTVPFDLHKDPKHEGTL
jgi:DNA-binding transcriptional MerR regulator